MTARTLDQWLDHIDGVHPVGIDLGLERIGLVARRMGFSPPAHRPAPRSVIVAGTNGKGSTCLALEALLRNAGLRVGTTLSPHVHVFNERVRIDGAPLDDAALCAALARVDEARDDVPLTYFEFSALVALDCFRRAEVDVAVLEVGLGGRLDAFNLVAADLAVITSIGLDHQDFLGADLEGIGREKAGVLRPGQQVVLGAEVTESVLAASTRLGCRHSRLGIDFHIRLGEGQWDYSGVDVRLEALPVGPLAPANWALALEAARHLGVRADPGVAPAVASTTLPGRMEGWLVGTAGTRWPLLLDVAHNPSGARFLARQLAWRRPGQRYVAVLGMLRDKDCEGVVSELREHVRYWVCVTSRGARGLSAGDLAQRIGAASDRLCDAVPEARRGLSRALSLCQPGDGILTFGSFDVVEQMREALLAGHEHAVPVTDHRPMGCST